MTRKTFYFWYLDLALGRNLYLHPCVLRCPEPSLLSWRSSYQVAWMTMPCHPLKVLQQQQQLQVQIQIRYQTQVPFSSSLFDA